MLFKLTRFLLIFLSLGFFPGAKVYSEGEDEGMWIPYLLQELNESDMKARGLKLSAKDIYDANNSSLKDAVVSFGGFCTAELISQEGLIITNHHCGFGSVQKHSSPETDLITTGYWAKDKSEELQNPGLTATFIVRIEDVTSRVLADVKPEMTEQERTAQIQKSIIKIKADAVKGTHYTADIKAFFFGNEYYMFITETFRDVRLVGVPPLAIGNYGGDVDNWAWPRHTGDFSIFRIYADSANKPADYSPKNVPYKPKKHFTISLKGISEGDFTMVYGFPGRTSEYLTSYAIEQTLKLINPTRITLRTKVLDIYHQGMSASDTVRIQYAAKEASISNYWKKWTGESFGLKRSKALDKKLYIENKFRAWVYEDPVRVPKYANVLPKIEQVYKDLDKLVQSREFLNECILRVEILNFASTFMDLVDLCKKAEATPEAFAEKIEKLKKSSEAFYKDFDLATDRKMFKSLMVVYNDSIEDGRQPAGFLAMEAKYKGDFNKMGDDIYNLSIFTHKDLLMNFLNTFKVGMEKKIEADLAYKLVRPLMDWYNENIKERLLLSQGTIDQMSRTYMEGLRQMQPEKKFYPDANGTLRITFGQVDDYVPRDGIVYDWYTTMEGIMEKYVEGDEKFDVPDKLIDLYNRHDYGRYAGPDGIMHVCFTASNHTTGGNSGSPVLNAEGQLIGTNFDRNWEGTMSDIIYDPARVRNISVDIRYVLFIIDKFAGAGYLLNEMTIVQ